MDVRAGVRIARDTEHVTLSLAAVPATVAGAILAVTNPPARHTATTGGHVLKKVTSVLICCQG